MDRRAEAGLAVSAEDLTEEQHLLHLLSGYRGAYVGRDPAVPRAFWNGSHYLVQFPDGVVRSIAPSASPVVPIPVVRSPYPMPLPGGYR